MTREEAAKVDLTVETGHMMEKDAIPIVKRMKEATQILATPEVDWSKWKLSDCSIRRNALETLVCIYEHNHIDVAISDRAKLLFDAIALDTVEQMEKILVPTEKRFEFLIRNVEDRKVVVNGKDAADARKAIALSDGETIMSIKEVANA